MRQAKLIAYFLICSNLSGLGQKTKIINIKQTGALQHDASYKNGAQRLINNVICEHEGVLLYCDSAYLYKDNTTLEAYSNVRITQGDSITLNADSLIYDGSLREAEVMGNVRMSDGEMNLNTNYLVYDLPNHTASYFDGGTIISKDNTLESKIGHYNSQSKHFTFKDSVTLTNPEYTINCDTLQYNSNSKKAFFIGPSTIAAKDNIIYCENGWYDTQNNLAEFKQNARLQSQKQSLTGDSIFYDRNEGIGKAYGNVSLVDSTNNMILMGNVAEHNELTQSSIITDKALLIQPAEEDSLFLHADTLRAKEEADSIKHGSTKKLYAFHNVKFYKKDIQGKCDSLFYDAASTTMFMFNAPILWSDENQLTAKRIKLKVENGEIKKMYLTKSAFIASKNDSSFFNQIKGINMQGYFHENKLYKVDVKGNGRTIYFPLDSNKYIGMNKSICSNLTIHLSDNKVKKVTFLTQPEATLHPIDGRLSNEMTFLKGFVWLDKERPKTKKDIFAKGSSIKK